jgi:hypothetical protein
MPQTQFAKDQVAQAAGDVAGVTGTAILSASWLANMDTAVSVVGGIIGVIAIGFSIRLNILRYNELKAKQERRNEQSDG